MTAPDDNASAAGEAVWIPAFLSALDPATATPDPKLIDLALTFVTHNTTHEQLWLPWAQYAYRAVRQLPDAGHERAVHAARTYAEALGCHGRYEEAVEVWQQLLDRVCQQPPDVGEIGVRIDFAAALHAVGRCGQAVREIGHALTAARTHHPHKPLLTVTCTGAYLAMLTACGRLIEAAALRRAARTWLHTAHQPGSLIFCTLVTLHVPEIAEHDDVCAANLDRQFAAAGGTPPVSPPRPSMRERLLRFGVATDLTWSSSSSFPERPQP